MARIAVLASACDAPRAHREARFSPTKGGIYPPHARESVEAGAALRADRFK